MKRVKQHTGYLSVKISAFLITMVAFALLALILPLRPTYSEIEKRDLTKFPSFTWAAFWSGEYFKNIDTWYADTFPFREAFIAANTSLHSLYGIAGQQIQGVVTSGDEIPDSSDSIKPSSSEKSSSSEQSSEPSSSQPEPDDPDVEVQSMGPILIAGDSAYEYYSFSRSESERYVNMLNAAATKFQGQANVYDIIIPNSMDIMLSNTARKRVNSSDQHAAIDYMHSLMNDQVKKVPIFDTMYQHRKEYTYFRTDHHWTALGAYYAYGEYAKVKGFTAIPLDQYQSVTYEGFLGSFYSKSGMSQAMANNPDQVVAYLPKSTNEMVFTNKSGDRITWPVINDVSTWNAAMKYNAFIGGDNPYSEIQNPNLSDGSACIVVKESYGNAFVPFLVDHYQTVYVIDYRYYNGKLADLIAQTGAEDVIFINNIMATSTSQRIGEMEALTS